MSDPGPQPYHRPAEESLPRFSLERRVTVLVLVASLLVVGTVATLGIPIELIPGGFENPHLGVRVPWRDAPPAEVLEKIVLPLEEELSTVRGVDSLRSTAREGFGSVFMSFKSGTDMDVAYREVRDRVQRARARLPEDADRVFLRKDDETGIPVTVLGLAIDPELTDAYNLIQQEIVLPLQRIDGVAAVTADGLEEKEILIELDRGATEAAGLDIYRLGTELAGDNFTLASGTVLSGGAKLLLRSVARYDDLEALRDRPIATDGAGLVRLGDIATIRYAEPERKHRARAMSRPAVALLVLKEGEANTLEVAGNVREALDRMRTNPRLRQIQMELLFDQGEAIRESLDRLLDAGLLGGVIALIVLFFFLGRIRMTLVVTTAIPLSLVVALTVMYFAGESLNILSLLGLMISVGMLVDNSVVVAENVARLRAAGLSRRDSAIRGAGEISLAILTATLTTVAVFLPVSLVEGDGQFFLLRLSIPISVSLLGSLFVALVFVPLASFLTLSRQGERRGPWRQRFDAGLKGAYERTFGSLNHGYNRLLATALRHRLDMVIALCLALAVTGWAAGELVKVSPTQEDEGRGFEIDVEMPEDTTLAEAEEWFLAAEKVVEGMQAELDLAGYFLFHRATGGELQGWFEYPRTNDVTPREATERVMAALPEKPGMRLYTGQEDQDEDPDEGLHTLTLHGEDAALLEEAARGLEEAVARVPGVLGLKSGGERAPNEMALVLDRERAGRMGVEPQVVAGIVGYALRGQALPRYSRDGKEIPVRVRFQESDRDSLAELASFRVPAGAGADVPLSALTDARRLPAAERIDRRDRRIARTVTAELREGEEEAAGERIDALAASFGLPEGITFGDDQDQEQGMDEDVEGMLFAAALSIVFIYLLMGFLFESFILPLSIVLTIPLAGMGVVWAHVATGLNLDVLGFVGIVLLIGVVVNNGIVLVDTVHRLREEGLERTEALLTAADRRFRPILMTALTTICGMIPLTFGGASRIGLSYTSFGLTLTGGMTTATLLTLLVVPVFYSFFDDARAALARAVGGRGRGSVPAAVETP
jgi:hydrophobic/amphiphilic exporter-1 (mainly G- bacteria), HAE1 family